MRGATAAGIIWLAATVGGLGLAFGLTGAPAGAAGDAGRAQWRREARKRIERHRKAELSVRVVGRDAAPVEGARVEVRMLKHAFRFGTAVNARILLRKDTDGRTYRQVLTELFNHAVMENSLKWPRWQANPRPGVGSVRWLRDNGFTVRGHCLVWPSWKRTPKDLRQLADDPEALQARIVEHIREEAGALKGMAMDWDVVNEPYRHREILDVLGREAMVEWFRAAHQADPDARLFLNEIGILAGGGDNEKKISFYEELVGFLLERGAPLGGIGMQSHFYRTTPPRRVWQVLDRFARFNLPIVITEFDVGGQQEAQADYTRDFLTAAFAHPAVDGFLFWGFWAGRHWRSDAALFRRDWSIKPNGEAYRELVLEEWWTEEEGLTDEDGSFEVRGFLGDYRVTVEALGETQTLATTLPGTGRALTVTLP